MAVPRAETSPIQQSEQEYLTAIGELIAPLSGLTVEQIASNVEEPKNTDNGDYALPIGRLNKFKKLADKPAAIAERWAKEAQPKGLVTAVLAVADYLNFRIDKRPMLRAVLKEVSDKREKFGTHPEFGAGKNIVVEYSSPNIAKPFHAGHLRSTIIGNFLKNLHVALGYNVTGINYLGDWGKQYGILAVGFKKYGSEEKLAANPIRHLFEVYVQINKDLEADKTIDDDARAYFKRMEDGDAEALSLWRRFRELSIEEYKKIYARLGIQFDVYSGESLYEEGMRTVLAELEAKGLVTEDKGAKIVDLKAQKLGAAVVQKSDGATLYLTRDLAAAFDRAKTYGFERMYYVVAAQQDFHFKQVFKILELMGHGAIAQKCVHINFGMVKGMSTRKGTVQFLEDILNEAQATMLEQMQQNEQKMSEVENPEATADTVGLSAVTVQDLSARRNKDYDFNLQKMTAFEGDTGPYLQYAHARLCSMERKTGIPIKKFEEINAELLNEPAALDLALQIAKYPDVVKAAYNTLEPCTIVAYLMKLSHAISAAHNELWVKGAAQELAEARMMLYWAAKIALHNGMRLLGLQPLERM